MTAPAELNEAELATPQSAALKLVAADDGPLWPWVNERGIGKPEYDRRSAVAKSVLAAIRLAETGERT